MNIIPFKTREPTETAALSNATVSCVEGQTIGLILPDDTTVNAQRAASCLLEPAVGDVVLLAAIEQQYWILAILEQANPLQQNLHFQGLKLTATHLVQHSITEQHQVDEHYSLKTKVHLEDCSGLRHSQAKVSLQQAEQVAITADKVLIN